MQRTLLYLRVLLAARMMPKYQLAFLKLRQLQQHSCGKPILSYIPLLVCRSHIGSNVTGCCSRCRRAPRSAGCSQAARLRTFPEPCASARPQRPKTPPFADTSVLSRHATLTSGNRDTYYTLVISYYAGMDGDVCVTKKSSHRAQAAALVL